MEVLDARQISLADRHAIDHMHIPGLILMENAGLRAVDVMADEIDGFAEAPVFVLCGRGNNGGDGFVVARHLARLGLGPRVALVGATLDELRGDAAAMAGAWTGAGGEVAVANDEPSWSAIADEIGPDAIVVDALFGTGLSRPLEGLAARVVFDVNRSGAFVVSIDVPSGLLCSEARVPGPAIAADLTITFARPKPALLLPPAEELCGTVVVVDIGIPDLAIHVAEPRLHWVTAEDAAVLLPERDPSSHKGDYGHVLVVAGSVGKGGAAALAGVGALTIGAGLVTVAAPAPARAEIASFAPEIMTEPLPAGRSGALAKGASTAALALAAARSVLAVGPGLGAATPAEVRRIVREARVPVVLDADGLNVFAGAERKTLAKRRAPLVVTPHPGEAARLMGVDTEAIQEDRVGWARRIAAEMRAVCVLKGYRTIVADAEGHAFINPTGNPGMASGGMGDVLTGMIAGLLAQEIDPLEASILAVYLHGLAADLACIDDHSPLSLTATAVLAALPTALRALEGDDEEDDEA